jgi:hypothetical protein
VIVACGCGKTPAAPASGSLPDPAASTAKAAPAPPGPGASTPAPPLLPDGCWAGANLQGSADELLADLERRCLAGLEPLSPGATTLELASGASGELSLTLDRVRCVRVLATGEPAIEEIELALVQGRHRLGEDDLRGRFALVEPRGPVCLDPGTYAISLRAPRSGGKLRVRTYAPK